MDIRLHLREEGLTSTVEVEPIGGGVFRLLDNSVFNCHLTRGTGIKAEPKADGAHEFIGVTGPSELITRRFFLSDRYRRSDYRMLGEELSGHAGFWQVDFGRFLTIDLPNNFPYDIDQVMNDLDMRLAEVVDDLVS